MTELLTTAANNWRAVLAGLQPWWPVLAVAMALEVMRPGKSCIGPPSSATSSTYPSG
ncbi:MAG: hypothetical protein U1E74_05795 [Paenacidovorax caeni]